MDRLSSSLLLCTAIAIATTITGVRSWVVVPSSPSSRTTTRTPHNDGGVPAAKSISSYSSARPWSRRGMGATVEDDATAETVAVDDDESTASSSSSSSSSALSSLRPEYLSAYASSESKLASSIPEERHGTMLPLFKHFVAEYLRANQDALDAYGDASSNGPDVAAERILTGMGYALRYGTGPDRYAFDVTHRALRGRDPDAEDGNTVDFYRFGCEFFSTCMDIPRSVVLGEDVLARAVGQVAAGENVVLFANHQSEADPQVVSALFEKAGYGEAAADMVYVAGHKVTTDPMAIPFSMGRNLICIHSKKHIDADPETKADKQRQNLLAMNGLLEKLRRGGTLVWIAPSGGRDRRDVGRDVVPLAPFDSKTIDMFRLMGRKSKVPTHYYTLAMLSYFLCPPPDFVEAGVGEQRNVRFIPVGIAMSEEFAGDDADPMALCQENYDKLVDLLGV